MDSENTIMLLPYSTMEERDMLTNLLKGKEEDEKVRFMTQYVLQRKDPQQILVFCLIGFLGFNGVHRFMLDEILLGFLFLITGGFCLVGTIVDAIRYKEITFQYNRKMARMVFNTVF